STGQTRTRAVAVAPHAGGGTDVYIVSYSNQLLAQYTLTAGGVFTQERRYEGFASSSVDYLDGPTGIRVSPDGQYLYVATTGLEHGKDQLTIIPRGADGFLPYTKPQPLS